MEVFSPTPERGNFRGPREVSDFQQICTDRTPEKNLFQVSWEVYA